MLFILQHVYHVCPHTHITRHHVVTESSRLVRVVQPVRPWPDHFKGQLSDLGMCSSLGGGTTHKCYSICFMSMDLFGN